MNLTGLQIIREQKKGKIAVSPFNEHDVNPNSYNYHLSSELYVLNRQIVLDPLKKTRTKKIPFTSGKGYVLQPGHVYLASTAESIGSEEYVISLIGRSSLGRLGLFLQITADLGQLGTNHAWTLELTVVQPLKIYPGMKIGQITFWKRAGKNDLKYKGGYALYSKPHISDFYKEV